LQRAWNRAGGSKFGFPILEFVEDSVLLARERAWIELTRCTDRALGFNVHLHTTSPGSAFGLTWAGFRDPSENHVTILNLHAFCRGKHLCFSAIAQLARGRSKLKSHKG